jgi:hypothetical protein
LPNRNRERYKSQKGNLAVPLCDFLVFTWRRIIRAYCLMHRMYCPTYIVLVFFLCVASPVESFSFPCIATLHLVFTINPLRSIGPWSLFQVTTVTRARQGKQPKGLPSMTVSYMLPVGIETTLGKQVYADPARCTSVRRSLFRMI